MALVARKRKGKVAVSACIQIVCAQPADVTPAPAVPYIVRAFDSYPLVAVSEMHRSRETMALLASVIRHPAFAGKVTNIVVEFGNARYQGARQRNRQ